VASLAFSPDGNILAAGYNLGLRTGDGVVLWDVAGRKRVVEKPLPVTEGSVSSLAFSPCGNILAAGYARASDHVRGGVVLWDVAERKRVIQAPLPVKEGPVGSVVFSPNGKTLAAKYGLRNSRVVLWDVAERKRVIQAPLHVWEGRVASVAFSPDGKTLAIAYLRAAGVVRPTEAVTEIVSMVLWDVAEHKLVVEESLPVNYGTIGVLVFSPDCKTLAAGYSYVRGLTQSYGELLWDLAGPPRGN